MVIGYNLFETNGLFKHGGSVINKPNVNYYLSDMDENENNYLTWLLMWQPTISFETFKFYPSI